MTETKVYIEENLPNEGNFSIYEDFIDHYLTNVRRLSAGDQLRIAGNQTVAEARMVSEDPLTVELKSSRPIESLDHKLVIYQAITRKNKFEETVKIGTELGVTRFVPIITERTVRVPNNPEKQLRRWKKIAMDSARISERDELPDISLPREFKSIEVNDPYPVYLADPEGEPVDDFLSDEINESTFIVGPEGGFTDNEKGTLKENISGTVSLGERNLRAETASVALSSIWLNRTGNI